MEKLILPYVIDKTLKENEFNPQLIYRSLLKETSISEENASKVTEQVVRTIISISKIVKIITAPTIREITNSVLLQFGLEIERSEYTRIGFPVYDLKILISNKAYYEGGIDTKIAGHVKREYYNVLDITKRLKKLKEDNDK